MPLRYSQGISSSMLLVFRRYGGRIFEENGSASSVRPAIVHARLLDLDRPDARHDRSLAAGSRCGPPGDGRPRSSGRRACSIHSADFRLDGLRQHPLGALSRRISVSTSRLVDGKDNVRCGNFLHGGVLLGNWVFEQPNSNPSTPPFSTPHPQHSVISPQIGDVSSFVVLT